jgi:hypothetical protein
MPVESLNVVVALLKRDTPSIDVLVTLSNLAMPPYRTLVFWDGIVVARGCLSIYDVLLGLKPGIG